MQQLAAELGTALNKLEGDFSVSVDKDSGMVVILITDAVTGEVVRQVPSKELLEADRNMERIVGSCTRLARVGEHHVDTDDEHSRRKPAS